MPRRWHFAEAWMAGSRSFTGTLSPSRSEVAERGGLQGRGSCIFRTEKHKGLKPSPGSPHTRTQRGAGALRVPMQASRVGGGPLPCAARVQTGSPGGGHGLGLVPRAVEPPEEGSRIQPLKAPGAAGDWAVGVGRGVGPTGRQRGQSGQLAVLGEGRRGPWTGESVTSHPSPAQGCPGGHSS